MSLDQDLTTRLLFVDDVVHTSAPDNQTLSEDKVEMIEAVLIQYNMVKVPTKQQQRLANHLTMLIFRHKVETVHENIIALKESFTLLNSLKTHNMIYNDTFTNIQLIEAAYGFPVSTIDANDVVHTQYDINNINFLSTLSRLIQKYIYDLGGDENKSTWISYLMNKYK